MRKKWIALLGVGILTVNSVIPNTMLLAYAADAESEQMAVVSAGEQIVEEQIPDEQTVEEGSVERTEAVEEEIVLEAEEESMTEQSAEEGSEESAEESIIIESGSCGATTEDNVVWTVLDSNTD